MSELKPCPCCGGVKLRIIRDQVDVMLGVEGSVLCLCGVKIPVNKWNTRIEDKQLAAAKDERDKWIGLFHGEKEITDQQYDELQVAKEEIAELRTALNKSNIATGAMISAYEK